MWFAIDNLRIAFGQRKIVEQLSISLAKGEIACLLGPSGCGKTTVLRSIAGFEVPDSGQILLDDQTLFSENSSLPPHARQVGMVFQDYALFPHLTVKDNIAFGLTKLSKAAKEARVKELLSLINLESYGDYYPHQLSGGQQQRVATARALAPKPKLLLLDEPFSNLDADLRTSLAQEIRNLLKAEGITAILVTHDQQEAFAFSDKIGILSDGVLQQWDSPENLFHKPCNEKVASFLGKGQWLKAFVKSETVLQSALGQHYYDVPHGLSIGTEVKLLVRTHEVLCCEDIAHNARVVQTDFQGEHIRHHIELMNGEKLVADWPCIRKGNVAITLNVGEVIAF